MIIFGSRYYGRVDRIEGLFRVQTRFFHLWFIPIIPLESWVVTDEREPQHGQKIRLSWKSVLVAWSRFLLGVMFLGLGGNLVLLAAPKPALLVHPLVAAICFLALMAVPAGLFLLTYRWARPSAQRTNQLATWMGVDPGEAADRWQRSYNKETSEKLE